MTENISSASKSLAVSTLKIYDPLPPKIKINAQIESAGKILGGSRETLKQKVVLKVPEILNNGLKLVLVRSPSEHAAHRQGLWASNL